MRWDHKTLENLKHFNRWERERITELLVLKNSSTVTISMRMELSSSWDLVAREKFGRTLIFWDKLKPLLLQLDQEVSKSSLDEILSIAAPLMNLYPSLELTWAQTEDFSQPYTP